MSKVVKVLDFIDRWAGPVILFVIIIDVFLQVLSRVLPGNSISWTVELGQILLGALVWLSISEGVKKGAHVNFDIIIRKFSKGTQKTMEIVNNGLFTLYLVLMGTFTVQLLEYYTRLGSKSTILQISMFWVRMPILIGCILTVITLIIKNIELILARKK